MSGSTKFERVAGLAAFAPPPPATPTQADDITADRPVTLAAYRAMRTELERRCADAESRAKEWQSRAVSAELACGYSSEIERRLRAEIASLRAEITGDGS